jgi:hypothetical protein
MEDMTWVGSTPSVPRYCPRCRVEASKEGPLCVECGETLRPQAYCPTCERFWKLDAGNDCPKHEIELLDDAPPEIILPPGERASLVTVATYSHPNQANAPRIRLEAEGIPTFLDGERIAGNTLYQVATGGVRLQVPASLASAARILIDQTWTAPDETDEDLDDAWEDLAPDPGARRRTIMKGAILVVLFGPVVVGVLSSLMKLLGQ